MSFNFGTTAIAAPAASSRFSFGGASTPTPSTGAAPGGGFSFGGGAAAATPAPATGGFGFGGASTATPAPASGGFSFGGSSTAATPAASGGFSFGGATTAAAPANAGGFSFGAAAPATQTTTPSFFGTKSTTGSSMFGANPAGTTSAFGSAPGTTATPSFGGFNTGFGTTQQPVQQAPTQPPIKLETTFDTLPADVKKNMTDFHKVLKDEDQADAFLKSVSARKLDALNSNLEQLEQDVLLRRNLQDRQATAVHHVRKDVKHLIHQVDTATLNLRSMSGESTSQRFYGIMRRVDMPSPYYWELLDTFEARMEQLKTQIESVESDFKPLYDQQRQRGSHSSSHDAASFSNVDPALLQHILVSQNAALIQVAAHVAEVHEKTEDMRQAFIRRMKDDMRKHGETNMAAFKNPFDKKKKNSALRDSEIDHIRFKTSVVPTIVATQQPLPQQQQAAPTTGFSGFNMTPAASTGTTGTGFSTTPGFGLTTAATSGSIGGSSLFSGGSLPATTAAPTVSTGGSGFKFGTSTPSVAAPKQVSFSLGGSAAPTVSTGAASTGFGFGAPATPAPGAAAAPGGFGTVGGATSFMPVSTPAFGAGDKRSAAGTASKSGGLRSRQKKR